MSYNILLEKIGEDFSMAYATYLKDFVQSLLPTSAELITLEKPHNKPAVIMTDIDGDDVPELIVAYKWREESYVSILRAFDNLWIVMDILKGKGYNVNYLDVGSITDESDKNIIIGWQVGGIWSQLDIVKWSDGKFKRLIGDDIYYSKIGIEDMPSNKGRDGQEEIALWVHDTGEAYRVEVYRRTNGELIPAIDVYPYYFKRVVAYYESLIRQNPDYPFYWYYLADAQLKSEMPEKALLSIDMVIRLKGEYPSKEDLLKLKEDILLKLKIRYVNLYSASIKTVEGIKWGYIDDKGNFIIKPIYDYAMNFQENGLAIVQVGSLNGVIDANGRYIIPPKYESISGFSEGRAAVIDKGRFKVIDETGKVLTSRSYSYIGTYIEGRAIVAENVQEKYVYGYIDREGREIIPLQHKAAYDFKNGKAIVQVSDNQFILINLKGDRLQTYNYAFVGTLGDNGLLAFSESIGGRYGFIDEGGNIVITPQYAGVQPFRQGRAVVTTSEDFTTKSTGLIDTKGNFIIRPQYNELIILGEDRVAVGEAIDEEKPFIGSKYAIADVNGNFVTDFIYYNVSEYNNGLSSVYDAKNTYFIDRSGKAAPGLPIVEGNGALSILGNLIKANVDLRTFYLDRAGKVVWTQNKQIPLSNQYVVLEEKYKPNKDYLVYYPQIEGMLNKTIQENVNKKLKELSKVRDIPSDEQLDISFTGDFSVEFFKKQLLVLELNSYEYPFGAAHGMPYEGYPHIDLVTGRFYELKDLFKENSNYVQVLSDIIGEQIKNNEEYSYVFPDTYKGISENQPFYVNEEALYIYFEPYEIAPYAAGFPTFKVPYIEIMSIIDEEGAFWQSFN